MITPLSLFAKKDVLIWLPHYLKQVFFRREISGEGPLHIILAVVDHFEPFSGNASRLVASERMKIWIDKYPEFAEKFKDVDGRHPCHTWFYPPHHNQVFLKDLVPLCKSGYGEIEMHLHHNHMPPFPDTSDTLRKKILDCIDAYSRLGIFCLPDKTKKFAFIHGDWSLDNSLGDDVCGVNDEISILQECGCFADFTFPAPGKSQPSFVNEIYYCKDNPHKEKSYNWGRKVVRGYPKLDNEFLIVQGIMGFRWKSRIHRFRPSIETSNLDKSDYPSPRRLDFLVKNGIRIKGKPDYIFIKLHTHGAEELAWDSLFGDSAKRMHSYLSDEYNDGKHFCLHYVSAREMYNIIKAVEADIPGNPNGFRNFEIPRYIYCQ